MTKAKKAVPEGFHTITPVLTLDEARKAIDWYKKALGAEEVSSAIEPGSGRIMHAEIRIGGSPIMLSDAVMGNKGPRELGGSPASVWIYVEDPDALFNRAVEAGAQVRAPMNDAFWGDRFGAVDDPFGYTWSIAARKEDLTREEMGQRQAEFFEQMAGHSR
jgi:PhnB protein